MLVLFKRFGEEHESDGAAMIAKHVDDVVRESVTKQGSLGVQIQVLLGQADGAPGFTLRLFTLAPHGHTPQHHHGHEHQIIIHSGSGVLWTRESERRLAPGLVLLVAPDEEHQFRAGPQGLQFYCIVPHVGHA